MRYTAIIAGGSGTRLWPMSRAERPKQLLPIINGRSLLQLAVDRLDGLMPAERQFICTGEAQRDLIRASIPSFSDERILGEPVGRDTVNAVGFVAAVLHKSDPDAIFAVLTADHLIEPIDEFQRKLDEGFELVEADLSRFVTFSIRPTRPATGYGYVERGEAISGFSDAFQVGRFIEKPDAKRARELLDSGDYGWNSGMFVFSAATVLQALEAFAPKSHAGLMNIASAWGTPRQQAVLNEVYPTLPRTSIDYALMEPASSDDRFALCTVLMNVNWLDVGCWASYGETLPCDEQGNRTNARHVQIDSHNVVAISCDAKHTIATVGCEDLIIVHTPDATLICPIEQAQRVKDIASLVDEDLR